MKRNGEKLVKPATKLVVFQREDEFIEFTLSAVGNRKSFDKMVPEPKPVIARSLDGTEEPQVQAPNYKAAVEKRNDLFRAWLVINAISPSTEWLEWEQVDLDKPETWLLWEDEMEQAGISYGERTQLTNHVIELNALSRNAVDEALKSFFLMMRKEQKAQNSLAEEKQNTTSSEPASASESLLTSGTP